MRLCLTWAVLSPITAKLAQEPKQLQQINLIRFGGSQKAKEAHRGAAGVESGDHLACKPMVGKA